MTPTPFHYLLPRATFELIAKQRPDLLQDQRILWVEDRLHGLGAESPVRLFFRTAADKREVQLQLIYSTGDLLAVYTDIQPETLTA